MLKVQHPEYELTSTGIHARSGVSCADCHMPYVREGSVKVSDHWLRSPLMNLDQACQTCHRISEEELLEWVTIIQDTTAELLRRSEEALAEARQLHRSAQLRWDFISSENSTGFHSPQEAARVLAMSIDMARQAELSAYQVMTEQGTAAQPADLVRSSQ